MGGGYSMGVNTKSSFPNLNINKQSFNVSFGTVNLDKGNVDTFDSKMNPTGFFRRTINRWSNARLLLTTSPTKELWPYPVDHHDGWEGWDTVPDNIIETRSHAPQLEGEAAEEAVEINRWIMQQQTTTVQMLALVYCYYKKKPILIRQRLVDFLTLEMENTYWIKQTTDVQRVGLKDRTTTKIIARTCWSKGLHVCRTRVAWAWWGYCCIFTLTPNTMSITYSKCCDGHLFVECLDNFP